MNAKTILGIIIIILALAIYLIPGIFSALMPYANLWVCELTGGPRFNFHIGCAITNSILPIIMIIIGAILIYLGKSKTQKAK